jgi:hypothetical protein
MHPTCRQIYVCGDVGREVIRLTHFQGDLTQGQGPYLLLTPYTHGVPHVDCEGPWCCDPNQSPAATRRKAPETCPHQGSNRVPREMQQCTLHLGHGGLLLDKRTKHTGSVRSNCKAGACCSTVLGVRVLEEEERCEGVTKERRGERCYRGRTSSYAATSPGIEGSETVP